MALVDDLLAQLAQQISVIINGAINTVTAGISTLYTPVVNYFNSLATQINGLFTSVTNTLKGILIDVANTIYDTLTGLLSPVISFINNAFSVVYTTFNELLQNANAVFTSLVTNINNIATQVRESITMLYNNAVTAVTFTAINEFNLVRQTVDSVRLTLEAAIPQTIRDIGDSTHVILQDVQAQFDKVLGGAGSLIEGISTKLGDVVTGFRDAGTAFLDSIRDRLPPATSEWVSNLFDITAKAFTGLSPVDVGQIQAGIGFLQAMTDPGVSPQEITHELLSITQPTTQLGVGLRNLILVAYAVWGIATAPVSLAQELRRQELNKGFPSALLSAQDGALSVRRKAIPPARAIEDLQRFGYSAVDAAMLVDNQQTVPALGDLLALWLRGLVNPAQLEDAFARLGVVEPWQSIIKDGAHQIPPVADLITMAVREAFSPEIAEAFGQFQEFPDAFGEWAEKKGLTKEWAQRYWASHWSLPSVSQAFEMFHRSIIKDDELDKLLRALDIMPHWRPKLTAMAYNPLTRVDIRRMHKLGNLTEAEVYSAYLDLGYSPDNALKLTEFTVKLNTPHPKETDEELGHLSRTNVLTFYADGVISRQKAIELLQLAGFTAQAAEFFVQDVDLKHARAERLAEVEFIITETQVGALTFEQAQDQLAKLKLSPVELERALTKITKAQAKAQHLPSLDAATNMFQYSSISESDYRALLTRLGFSAKWVDAFVDLAVKTRKKIVSGLPNV